jgi:Fibrinogen beta and gamma chains, C-terminal globular domain
MCVVCRFSGDTGNGLQYGDSAGCPSDQFPNGMQFTTYDADHDNNAKNCASLEMGDGGWWHNSCFEVCPTCGLATANFGNQFRWLGAANNCSVYALAEARMLMKLQ